MFYSEVILNLKRDTKRHIQKTILSKCLILKSNHSKKTNQVQVCPLCTNCVFLPSASQAWTQGKRGETPRLQGDPHQRACRVAPSRVYQVVLGSWDSEGQGSGGGQGVGQGRGRGGTSRVSQDSLRVRGKVKIWMEMGC